MTDEYKMVLQSEENLNATDACKGCAFIDDVKSCRYQFSDCIDGADYIYILNEPKETNVNNPSP